MILVTGGLGVMGTTLVKGLLAKGNKVRVIDIPNHPHKDRLAGTDAEIVYGDITKPETIADAFEGVDTIYHLAAILLSPDPARFERINVGGTRNMIAGGIRCGARHFILVSSISVTYPYTTPYSLSKRETERLIKEQDTMAYTIIRPTLAYNSYGGEEFMMYLSYLRKFPVVPFIGSGKAMKNPVHVDDMMKGFLAVANNPKSPWQNLRLQRFRGDFHPRPRQAHAPAPRHHETLRQPPHPPLRTHRRHHAENDEEPAALEECHRRHHPGRESRLVGGPRRPRLPADRNP